ncbi:CHAT domain-containing protein [Caulobacter soli]|uniref:CHAT domain-containing protein n=1 Tax=Caulobacter soli TaxID=2708539 RepID=UPI0013EC7A9D|nr:CHAT domain-containing protein [Caulobacter soli]
MTGWKALDSTFARISSAAARAKAERMQKSGEALQFRVLAAHACVILIKLARIEVRLETRPHPQEFTDALLRLDDENRKALTRAGALYAVALAQAGDYGQCIGFGVPALGDLQDRDGARVERLELLAALGSSYRALGEAENAAYCDRLWDQLEAEIQRLNPPPPWLLAMSSADALWHAGRTEEAISVLDAELLAHRNRRGKTARQASPWIGLMAAMKDSYEALDARDVDAIVRTAVAEAEAAWRMGQVSYDLAPELLLGRAEVVLDLGADPTKVRNIVCKALVFARDVRNKQALRWRVLDLLGASAGSAAERILLAKLAVAEVISLRSDLASIDDSLGVNEDGRLARLFSHLVSDLIAEGRLAEASMVMALRRQNEIAPEAGDERSGLDPGAALLLGPENAAAMIYYAARNAGEPSRALTLMSELGDHIRLALEQAETASARPIFHDLPTAFMASDALIQVMPGAEQTSLILRTSKRTLSRQLPVSARQINAWVFAALQNIEARAALADLPELAHLFDHLITPVEAALREDGVERLVIAASGALQVLPWSSLHDGKSWLVERLTICRAPTDAQILAQDLVRPPRFFLGGTGRGAPGLAGPIQIMSELEGVRRTAQAFGEITFAVERDFTRQAVLNAMATHSVVACAAHCLPDTLSPRRSRLLLGDGSTIPLEDLAQERSSADLVVLSACATGRSGASLVPGGDMSVDRLLSAAGVRSVISTAWKVDNDAQTQLILSFFDHWLIDGVGKDEALASIQRRMIAGEIQGPHGRDDWTRPYYWAAPMLTGNWRGFSGRAAASF